MEIFGRQIKLKNIGYYFFYALIVIDVFLITVALIFEIPDSIARNIQHFDWAVCIILLFEYSVSLYLAPSRRDFILNPLTMMGLVASIPLDLIFSATVPGSSLLRYLRLLKLLSIFLLSSRLQSIRDIFDKTGMHKVMVWFVATVILFTGLFCFFGPSFGGIDDLYFVIVTLTTVGYGDVTPATHNQKVLAMILILIGLALVSTITAVMSSFFTDRILENEDDEIRKAVEENSQTIMNELMTVKEENRQLRDEISELKELIERK
ncbi:potassium channel family protein [Methanobrevibacter sp.]|uniref:potassium channel family protein n=1 Tax=Methanobrevibacter sp. TaxID=66852 RepID=UPI0026DF3607|nr:potassium channel family protein [Methanobrevibacter sp.]MDO5859123.1 potassium channel family protein [Methanobrevibacter sp.]